MLKVEISLTSAVKHKSLLQPTKGLKLKVSQVWETTAK